MKGGRYGLEEQMRDHGEVRDVFVRGPEPSYDSPDIPKSRHVTPQSVHAVSSAASINKKSGTDVKLKDTASKLKDAASKKSNTTFKKQATTPKLGNAFIKKPGEMSA